MLKNYFIVAFRGFFNNKVYTIINTLGLAIGIAASVLIVLFTRHELTYDQHHENADNIYLVYKERITPNGIQPTYDTWVPLAHQLQEEYPEIKNSTRIWQTSEMIKVEDMRYNEQLYYADPEYFQIFDFPLLKGDDDNPLPDINSVVISEERALKYFGQQDPMGKTLDIGGQVYAVSGVLEKYPSNSFIAMDMIIALESHPQYEQVKDSWGSSFLFTYILLPPNVDITDLESKFPAFITKTWDIETQKRTNFKLLPLAASYDTFVGDVNDSYILLYIALGIILIASINFMNISTARSLERAKEIGMRKVMGAGKAQLRGQFLSEAILLSYFSMIIGIVLAQMLIPWINVLFSMELSIPFSQPTTWILLLTFGMTLGLISGSYPALYLSNFKILDSIKGGFNQNLGGVSIRNLLVIIQFALSVVLIVGSLTISGQLEFMKNSDMSFDKENLLVIPVSVRNFEDRDEAAIRLETFRNEIMNHSAVISSSNSRHVPGRWSESNTFVRPDGWEGDPLRMRITYHDARFFETYGIELLSGPNFLPDSEGNQRESVVLNQAAMKAFGWEDPEDKVIVIGSRKINVVGMIKDFNYETLRQEIQPILHFHRAPSNGVHQYITVKTAQKDNAQLFAFLQEKWKILEPTQPFSYFFIDENLNQMYATEDRLLKMVSTFTSVSIFIACLGLFGLSSFVIEKRRKEIGIRKVLGASVGKIIWMVSNSFTKLVLIGFLIGAPLSYYLMNLWLQDFVYHIDFSVIVLLITLGLVIFIAWLTVSMKSIKAATVNPIKSLKEE